MRITCFGAPFSEPEHAVAVLRARAGASGAALAMIDQVQAAACVIGADLWCAVLGTATLALPAQHGRPAVAALAAVLARSAGAPAPGLTANAVSSALAQIVLRPVERRSETRRTLAMSRYPDWLREHLGVEQCGQALVLAAEDLLRGLDDARLADAALACWQAAATFGIGPLAEGPDPQL